MVSYCVTEHFKPEPQEVKIASKGVLAGRLTLTPLERDPMRNISDSSSSSDEKYADQVRYEWYLKTGQWLPRLPADTKGSYSKHSTAEIELWQSISKDQDAKNKKQIEELEARLAAALEAIHGKDGAI